MNEFQKLDQFMRAHRPAEKNLVPPTLNDEKKLLPWFTFGAAVAALVIFLSISRSEEPLYMESVFVAESIEWEMEDDGLLAYYDVI